MTTSSVTAALEAYTASLHVAAPSSQQRLNMRQLFGTLPSTGDPQLVTTAIQLVYPLLLKMTSDSAFPVSLTGLIHLEQRWEWLTSCSFASGCDLSGRIIEVAERRGMLLFSLESRVVDSATSMTVLVGRSKMMWREQT